MRLIDADAYLELIKPNGISDELWEQSETYLSVMSMQTVDVISVKWLKRLVEQYYSMDSVTCHVIAYLIEVILKKWENEYHG